MDCSDYNVNNFAEREAITPTEESLGVTSPCRWTIILQILPRVGQSQDGPIIEIPHFKRWELI